MRTYIIRRLLLMIPTLFGITVISFCIMQLAPGDPLLTQLGPGGMTGPSSQTREAYLVQKRDLKLDKPLLLNFNDFKDYSRAIRTSAFYFSMPLEGIEEDLSRLADPGGGPELQERLRFLRSLGIADFEKRLKNSEQHQRLAQAVQGYLQVFLEDTGRHGVPATIALLKSREAGLELKKGAIRCLTPYLVVDPFLYTYSSEPDENETPLVTSGWEIWWRRTRGNFQEASSERRRELEEKLSALVNETSRARLFEELEVFRRGDTPFFAEKLLAVGSTLAERAISAIVLRMNHGKPLKVDVSLDAKAEEVEEAIQNWLAHYEVRRGEYDPPLHTKVSHVFLDTQYAHMVWRLITFNFGRSALKTREPVGRKIWNAVLVSAPIMVLAQLVVYLVAVPLGILCAVTRGTWVDRLVTFKLFLLYSVPPFVAGMLFLLFLCYGDYLKFFPMAGLHSAGAENFGWFRYLLDYLWHIFLPVVCLSLFLLAGMAMYARTSFLEVIRQDYIRTARAKGLSEGIVIFKHAARNALIPIITLFSNFLPAMLGGSVLIEFLFGIPGMGRLSWASIEQKDFPTLMALIYIDAIVVMLSILLTDLLYVFVDPRISFESQEKTR